MKKIVLLIFLLGLFVKAGAQSKMGDNLTALDTNSVLELESATKALKITRVALSSTTDLTTIPNPKAGMIVYNTRSSISGNATYPALSGGVGLYYCDSLHWIGCGGSTATITNWNTVGNSVTAGVSFLGTTNNASLVMKTNNTAKMQVDSTGVVRINETTKDQAYRLVVKGVGNSVSPAQGALRMAVTQPISGSGPGYHKVATVSNELNTVTYYTQSLDSLGNTYFSSNGKDIEFQTYGTTATNAPALTMRANGGKPVIGVNTFTPRADLDINGTGAVIAPIGTTAQRPATPVQGMIRFNTDSGKFEGYVGDSWQNLNF